MNRGREVLFVMTGPGLERGRQKPGANHHCRPVRSHPHDHMVWWGLGIVTMERSPVRSLGHLNFCQSRDIPTHGKSSPDPGSETGK